MVDLFKALAEENRLKILALLLNQEQCVCNLETQLNMNQSNVSRHLIALKQCGIVESSKSAQWAYYKISEQFKIQHQQLWLYLLEQMQLAPYKELSELNRLDNCSEIKLSILEPNKV